LNKKTQKREKKRGKTATSLRFTYGEGRTEDDPQKGQAEIGQTGQKGKKDMGRMGSWACGKGLTRRK